MRPIHIFLTLLLSLFFLWVNAQQGDTLEVQRNKQGDITFAKFKISESRKLNNGILFLKQILKGTPDNDFKLIKQDTDKLGIIHLRYQQYYKGVKVEGAEYLLHGRSGNIETVNGHYANISFASVKSSLDETQALTNAIVFVNAKKYKWQDPAMEQFAKQNSRDSNATYYPKGELVIIRDSLNDFQLAWKFIISTLDPSDELLVVINAITGNLIFKRTLILDNNVTCAAETIYSGNQNITGDTYTGGIRLREVRNGVNIQTLNLNHTFTYASATDFSNNSINWTTGSWANIGQDQAALDVHWAAEKVIDFWGNPPFNRNSIDGAGIRVLSYVHAGNSYVNAAWVSGNNNHFMQYGDGDGTVIGPLVALDIAAHEFGHGINEFTANLGHGTNGFQEEDALNEGLSDIWGTCVKHSAAPVKPEWLLGGEVLLAGTFNCFRNIQDPKSILAWEGQHPNTYLGHFWSGSGEPHFNSTVLSHWFYLVVQGGNGTNDNNNAYNVSGVGINEAQRIVYQAESNYLHLGDGYADARNAMVSAAQDLFGVGSCEEIVVTNAWYAVGVGAAYSGNAGLSISGAASFCTTSNPYTIPNLPTGATVTWSASPSGIVTINTSNAAQTTLTKTGNGNVTLSASITTPCNPMPVVVSKNIYAGLPAFNGPAVYNTEYGGPYPLLLTLHENSPIPNEICERYGGSTDINIIGATSLVWSKTDQSSGASVTWSQDSYNDLHFWIYNAGNWAAFKLTYGNQCGSGNVTYKFKAITCYPYPPHSNIVTGDQFTIAPNPASGSITISQNSKNTLSKTTIGKAGIIQVSITDVNGILKKQQQFGANTSNMKLDVSDLTPGVYFVLISNGGVPETQRLVIYR